MYYRSVYSLRPFSNPPTLHPHPPPPPPTATSVSDEELRENGMLGSVISMFLSLWGVRTIWRHFTAIFAELRKGVFQSVVWVGRSWVWLHFLNHVFSAVLLLFDYTFGLASAMDQAVPLGAGWKEWLAASAAGVQTYLSDEQLTVEPLFTNAVEIFRYTAVLMMLSYFIDRLEYRVSDDTANSWLFFVAFMDTFFFTATFSSMFLKLFFLGFFHIPQEVVKVEKTPDAIFKILLYGLIFVFVASSSVPVVMIGFALTGSAVMGFILFGILAYFIYSSL